MRAQGAGGQNVNKVSNAVHLRFDIRASSLPEEVKHRLLARGDKRISRTGVVVIKAQQHRSLEQNRAEAMRRLQAGGNGRRDAPQTQAHPAHARIPKASARQQKQTRAAEGGPGAGAGCG